MDPHPTLDEAPTTNGEALEYESKHPILNTLNDAYRAFRSFRRTFETFQRRPLEEYLHTNELLIECQRKLNALCPESDDYTLHYDEIADVKRKVSDKLSIAEGAIIDIILAEYPECESDVAALTAILQGHGEEQEIPSLPDQDIESSPTAPSHDHGEEREMPSLPQQNDESQTTSECTIQVNMKIISENDNTTAPTRQRNESDTPEQHSNGRDPEQYSNGRDPDHAADIEPHDGDGYDDTMPTMMTPDVHDALPAVTTDVHDELNVSLKCELRTPIFSLRLLSIFAFPQLQKPAMRLEWVVQAAVHADHQIDEDDDMVVTALDLPWNCNPAWHTVGHYDCG